jgi:hypothetical protein
MRLLEEENPAGQLQLSYQRIAVIYNRKLYIIQQNITVILNSIVVSWLEFYFRVSRVQTKGDQGQVENFNPTINSIKVLFILDVK